MMAIKPGYCACGKPLHYSNPTTRKLVERLVLEIGEYIDVVVEDTTYCVQRHFIALHGLAGKELPLLVAAGTIEQKS